MKKVVEHVLDEFTYIINYIYILLFINLNNLKICFIKRLVIWANYLIMIILLIF